MLVLKGAIIVLAVVAVFALIIGIHLSDPVEYDIFIPDDYWQIDEFDVIKEEGDQDAAAP